MTAAQFHDAFGFACRETASARFRVRADGVLHGTFLPVEQSPAHARENVRCAAQLLGVRRAPLILDMSTAGGLSQEVKRCYANAGATTRLTALAIVAATMLGRVQANLLIATYNLAGAPLPIGLFATEEEALAWVHANTGTQASSPT